MKPRNRMVLQTFSLFIVLVVLTLVVVLVFKSLFVGVEFSPAIPAIK